MSNSDKIFKLKLVEQSYYEKEFDIIKGKEKFTHSLQSLILNFSKLNSNIPAYFIDKYTTKGQCVLDPFCAFGTVPTETILRERISFATDIHGLAVKATSAKLNPVFFPKLALSLQMIDVKRLVSLEDYEKYFMPFFNIETYKEILSLKEYIQNNRNHITNFIELLMLSILHGPTSNFCSAPTHEEISVLPEKQIKINIKNKAEPEYRPIIPRLLKKASSVLEDHIQANISNFAEYNKCFLQDPRNLNKISSLSVDLILTELPLYYESDLFKQCWLKNWFCNIGMKTNEYDFYDEASWVDFMAEALMEFYRVLKLGKRIVFIIKDFSEDNLSYSKDYSKDCSKDCSKLLLDLINKQMHKYFTPEKCLIQPADENNISYKHLVIKKI
ncbi:MAG: hypothetical protein ACOX3T_00640 [Bdellovibrionota bacterium]